MHIDTLRAVLKQKGYSLTKPRVQVFEILLSSGPLSLSEIISKTGNEVDRATVYRTARLFEKLSITHRLNIGWKYRLELSEVFVGHHHHMHCNKCGKTYKLPHHTMLETMIDSAAIKEGFAPRGHQLEIYGICSSCS